MSLDRRGMPSECAAIPAGHQQECSPRPIYGPREKNASPPGLGVSAQKGARLSMRCEGLSPNSGPDPRAAQGFRTDAPGSPPSASAPPARGREAGRAPPPRPQRGKARGHRGQRAFRADNPGAEWVAARPQRPKSPPGIHTALRWGTLSPPRNLYFGTTSRLTGSRYGAGS